MKINTWKIAFWCCLALLIGVSLSAAYIVLDQGVTLTYQQEGYASTENDLEQLIEILNQTDLSKSQIQTLLQKDPAYLDKHFATDTVSVGYLLLFFENNRLKKVQRDR